VTVAAVIVPRDAEEALADAAGRAAVRRIVDIAWAGGALPLVVVVDDPDGMVAAAVAGSPAHVVPAPDGGAPYRAGAAAASDAVVGTDAWLLWPGSRTWVDPETVTSLIEAHGARPDEVLRPAHDGQPGWPLLVPVAGLELLDELDVAEADAAPLDLGDPGSVVTLAVAIDAVPDYLGPPGPVAGPPPDWGAAAAEEPD
jgi:hypothetical protein